MSAAVPIFSTRTLILGVKSSSSTREKNQLCQHLFFPKVLSLTDFVLKPSAPHQISSLAFGSPISNTALSNGFDAWVKK